MTKILIIGSGRVGTLLAQKLAKTHSVTLASRCPTTITGVHSRVCDLHAPQNSIANLVNGFNIIYFTAGSRGQDLLQTDLYGAVKVMKAAEISGVVRFVLLSSLHSLQPDKWPRQLNDYYIAKYFADEWLLHESYINYTIIQSGALSNEPGNGMISLGNNIRNPHITIDNVTSVLAAVIDYPQTINKVIATCDGKTPIIDALKAI